MPDLLVDKQGHTTIFTINRPQRMNSLGGTVMTDLSAGLKEFQEDPDQYVAIITGAGDKAFCAGGDLKEMAETTLGIPGPDFLPSFGRNIDVAKPTIAAVNGVAFAGGFLLAQMCDLVVAADTAKFAITEARVGRGTPWATPLPWLLPPRIAMELLVTGEPIDAMRAREVGLVNRVVPAAELRNAYGVPDQVAPASSVPTAAYQELVHLAQTGRRNAIHAFNLAGRAIGFGLSRLMTVANPAHVVITGPGANAFELMRSEIDLALKDSLVARINGAPSITVQHDEREPIFQGMLLSTLSDIDQSFFAPATPDNRSSSVEYKR